MTRSRLVGYAILAALILVGGGGLAVLGRYLFIPPVVGQYLSTEILTPVVVPTGASTQATTGQVIIRSVVEKVATHKCRISKALVVYFSDGSYRDGPGVRWAYPQKNGTAIIYYSTALPKNAPVGPAQFWARDTYDCGPSIQTMETAHMPFSVVSAGRLKH